MKDCTAGDVYRVFYIKTNRRRGGFLKDITCENVKARSARLSVFEIATDVLYEWADFPDYENRTTKISDIKARNIEVGVTKDLIRLVGDPAMPPERVSWRDVSASSVTGECRRVSNVLVEDRHLGGDCLAHIYRKTRYYARFKRYFRGEGNGFGYGPAFRKDRNRQLGSAQMNILPGEEDILGRGRVEGKSRTTFH